MVQRVRDKIRELRGELSQDAYAKGRGTYMLAISQLENGKRPLTVDLAVKIAGGDLIEARKLLIIQLDEDINEYCDELERLQLMKQASK